MEKPVCGIGAVEKRGCKKDGEKKVGSVKKKIVMRRECIRNEDARKEGASRKNTGSCKRKESIGLRDSRRRVSGGKMAKERVVRGQCDEGGGGRRKVDYLRGRCEKYAYKKGDKAKEDLKG